MYVVLRKPLLQCLTLLCNDESNDALFKRCVNEIPDTHVRELVYKLHLKLNSLNEELDASKKAMVCIKPSLEDKTGEDSEKAAVDSNDVVARPRKRPMDSTASGVPNEKVTVTKKDKKRRISKTQTDGKKKAK